MSAFGTSGLRGLADELLDGVANGYAETFGRFLRDGGVKQGDPVFVGRDLRASSPQLVREVCAGLFNSGLKPVRCGKVPTPALALHAMRLGAACVMVTGSHIPADRNGLKFYTREGEITKKQEALIGEQYGRLGKSDLPKEPHKVYEASEKNALDAYLARYREFFPGEFLLGKRIGLFEHSSVARDFLGKILEAYGATIIRLGRSDVFVPIDTEALGTEIENQLRKWSDEQKLDAILSTDADADRPLVVDERGNQVQGDALGISTALYLNADAIVTPVTSNSGLADHSGINVHRTRVGSPYVLAEIERLVAEGARVVAGFEANGGFILGTSARVGARQIEALPTRDAFLPMLSFLAQAFSRSNVLSAHVEELGLNQTCSGRLQDFSRERSDGILSLLRTSSQHRNRFLAGMGEVSGVDETDGIRITLAGGEIIHIRASGNAPEIRCYGEAATQERAEYLVSQGLKRLSNWEGVK